LPYCWQLNLAQSCLSAIAGIQSLGSKRLLCAGNNQPLHNFQQALRFCRDEDWRRITVTPFSCTPYSVFPESITMSYSSFSPSFCNKSTSEQPLCSLTLVVEPTICFSCFHKVCRDKIGRELCERRTCLSSLRRPLCLPNSRIQVWIAQSILTLVAWLLQWL
jgi:hypothetical protein